METPAGFRDLIPGRAWICNACGGSWWKDSRAHACPPSWRCREEGERLEDASLIFADGPSRAAEKYVEQSDDYGAEFTEETSVVVAAPDGGETTFRVAGEVVRQYHASEDRRQPERSD